MNELLFGLRLNYVLKTKLIRTTSTSKCMPLMVVDRTIFFCFLICVNIKIQVKVLKIY